MATAQIIAIADALKAEINGQSFSQDFTAERTFVPTYKLKDMDTLHVSVVPRASDRSPADRARNHEDHAIDIGIQKRFSDDTDLDGMMQLVEEISDFLDRRALAAAPTAAWIRTTNEPIWVPEHVEELHQFTSVLTVTYRITR